MRWNLSWTVIKDVALTGTAIWLIVTQVRSPHPSDVLLATALGLTTVASAPHAKALLTGRGDGPHSAPVPPPPVPPSAPSSEGAIREQPPAPAGP